MCILKHWNDADADHAKDQFDDNDGDEIKCGNDDIEDDSLAVILMKII